MQTHIMLDLVRNTTVYMVVVSFNTRYYLISDYANIQGNACGISEWKTTLCLCNYAAVLINPSIGFTISPVNGS